MSSDDISDLHSAFGNALYRKVVVDLQVAGLVDLRGGGKQQAPGFCSDQYSRRH